MNTEVQTKSCTKCLTERPVAQFGKHEPAKDGLASWCNGCRAALEHKRRRAMGVPTKKVPLIMADSKECLLCGELKEFSCFPKSSRGRAGRAAYCHPCMKGYANQRRSKDGGTSNREAVARYRQEHSERWKLLHRNHQHKRRQQKKTGSVSFEFLEGLYKQDICHYCNRNTPLEKRTADHVVALHNGGEHAEDNLVMACVSCNSAKGAKTYEDFTNDHQSRNSEGLPFTNDEEVGDVCSDLSSNSP